MPEILRLQQQASSRRRRWHGRDEQRLVTRRFCASHRSQPGRATVTTRSRGCARVNSVGQWHVGQWHVGQWHVGATRHSGTVNTLVSKLTVLRRGSMAR